MNHQVSDIHLAARNGNHEQILEYLQSGGDIESKNSHGHSLLMIAAYNGHYDLSEFLITKGADVNSLDVKGNSILMGVVFKGHASVFDLLVSAGADLSYINPKKQTALDMAIMFGKRDLIFKINQRLKTNRTAGRLEQAKAWINYLK